MKAKHLFLLLICWCFSLQAFAQSRNVTLSGYIKEAGSQESLIGANVYLPDRKTGTITNAYGFYSISLPPGEYNFRFSYVGYESLEIVIDLRENKTFDVLLKPATDLQEVVVTDDAVTRQAEQTQMSRIELSSQQIKDVPTIFGEKDLLKTLQLMPGVQSGNEGQTGFYVRGGGPDQNLILLDEATVYNANHLFGFFSVFNGDAIKNVSLTKGGFPARYGGRLSSVVDISMRDGDKSEFHGEAGIGLISAKATIEGPIVKDKASFIISGRRTYFDALVQPLIVLSDPGSTAGYYFHDFNAKVNYEIDRKNRLYLSGYFGRDAFYAGFREPGFRFRAGINWGNATGTLRWNHQYSDKLFINSALILSNYGFTTHSSIEEDSFDFSMRYSSSIRDFGLKVDADYLHSPKHRLRLGMQSIQHLFTPSAFVIQASEFPEFDVDRVAQEVSIESGVYVEDQWTVNERLEFNLGLRMSHFLAEDRTYTRLEPRLNARFMIDDQSSVKVAYSEMNQYLHLLSNTGIGLPTDLWVPANDIIGPQFSRQYAAGYSRDFKKNSLSFSAELYHKQSDNIITYRPGASFLLVDFDDALGSDVIDVKWEEQVTTGQATSYGMELFLQKHRGKFTGWIGYTLSKTDWQFDEINGGRPFSARYDRRHDLSIVSFWELSKPRSDKSGVKFSSAFVYGTGNAVTLPKASFDAPYVDPSGPQSGPQSVWNNTIYGMTDFGEINSYRLAPYHRLDVGVQFTKLKSFGERTLEFSVYNIYNRANPWFLDRSFRNGQEVLVQYSLFGAIPSIHYSIKF